MSIDKPIEINIDQVLRTRLPKHYRFIPRFLIRWIKRVICQEQLNKMLYVNAGKRDADFCRGVLEHLNVTYSIKGVEPSTDDTRPIIVCNHPLGGLDGMILIDYVTRHYGQPIKFIVNDLLMAVEPLQGVFLPINKHGHQSRYSSEGMDAALKGNAPVIIFPAGLVSRKGNNGIIADLEWKKTFVNKAIKYQRNIIPAYFRGRNSNFFYNFAKARSRIGLKFNIEMIRLPQEMFKSQGKTFNIIFGKPIPWQTLKGGLRAQAQADEIKRIAYSLSETELSCNSK